MQIIAAILEQTTQAAQQKINAIQQVTEWIHFDITTAPFTEESSLSLKEVLELETTAKKEIHIMDFNIKDSLEQCKQHKIERIYIHLEALQKATKEEQGEFQNYPYTKIIVLKEETKISELEQFKNSYDEIMLMSVAPGKQGGEFLESVYQKIEKLQQCCPQTPIVIDGGMTKERLITMQEKGVTRCVVGSAIMQTSYPQKALEELRAAL